MLGLGENEVKKMFYTYWTLKESYIKRIGLSIPLNPFSINQVNDNFEVDKTTSIGKIQLYTRSLEVGYMISEACGNDKKVKLIYMDLGITLCKFFNN